MDACAMNACHRRTRDGGDAAGTKTGPHPRARRAIRMFRMVRRDTGSRHVRLLRADVLRAYFTPCINLLTSGATTKSSTPEPTSAQKPKV